MKFCSSDRTEIDVGHFDLEPMEYQIQLLLYLLIFVVAVDLNLVHYLLIGEYRLFCVLVFVHLSICLSWLNFPQFKELSFSRCF